MPPTDSPMSDGTAPTGSKKRGRTDSHADGAGSNPQTKKARHPSSAAGSKAQKRGYHLKKGDVPKNAIEVQDALNFQCRVMWGLFSQDAIPPNVAGDLINTFNERFKASGTAGIREHVESLVNAAESASHETLKLVEEVKRRAHLESAVTAKRILRLEERFLFDIFSAVARAGLHRWAPDVLGSPDSLYNILHESIALSTFRSVLTSFGYLEFRADISYAQNHMLLSKLYRSFVFSHMAGKARKEARIPGAAVRDAEHNNALRRRQHLAKIRVQQLKDAGYRKEVVRLAEEANAHSDDELDETANPVQYRIRPKLGRSTIVTALFHGEDQQHQEKAKRLKKRGVRTDRIRIVPGTAVPDPDPSPHPLNVPIDYFEPDYYNTRLTLRERAYYMHNGVALPLAQFCTNLTDIRKWRRMSTKEFMKEYGDAVLELYDIPTEEELQRLADNEDDEDDEGDDLD